ncbi:MBL fold metallo-hydrolase [Deltaproteobacteria bacterium OttesenSCG-928-K17]|nr:MBL fold metallo-hydrolase [Deltaproteobacteria bacterium OttesenSCG-928-K17]
MNIKFWGVRGSIPSPVSAYDTKWRAREIVAAALDARLDKTDAAAVGDFLDQLPYHLLQPIGGNTSCVEVTSGGDRLILDMGSGLRALGGDLCQRADFTEKELYMAIETGQNLSAYESEGGAELLNLNILTSHIHWDHIQGFPFFAPAYQPGNKITIFGADAEKLAWALNAQQTAPILFPIDLAGMGASIEFKSFPIGEELRFGSLTVKAMAMPHPGGSLAYRLEAEGRSAVYATDYEFPDPNGDEVEKFVKFINGADILISDTQYTYLEGVAREGWGHSTSFGAIDLAMKAGIKNFFLFHHDPEHSDAKLMDNLGKTRAYYLMMSQNGKMTIDLAREGLTI